MSRPSSATARSPVATSPASAAAARNSSCATASADAPMKIQLLSDLHLESESFEPLPLPDAELLVLAGDIDSSWQGYERFAAWPVPVLVVAGNHEFDGREITQAWPALRGHCARLGLTLLERDSVVLSTRSGSRVRFVGSV